MEGARRHGGIFHRPFLQRSCPLGRVGVGGLVLLGQDRVSIGAAVFAGAAPVGAGVTCGRESDEVLDGDPGGEGAIPLVEYDRTLAAHQCQGAGSASFRPSSVGAREYFRGGRVSGGSPCAADEIGCKPGAGAEAGGDEICAAIVERPVIILAMRIERRAVDDPEVFHNVAVGVGDGVEHRKGVMDLSEGGVQRVDGRLAVVGSQLDARSVVPSSPGDESAAPSSTCGVVARAWMGASVVPEGQRGTRLGNTSH